MKVPTLFISLVLASIAAAQGNDKLPACAKDCADGFLKGGIGNCGDGDVKCICENESFLGGIACCLEGKCNKPDQSSAVAYASKICLAFQITNLPTSVSCTATTTGSGTTSTPASTTPAGSGTKSTPASTAPANAAATTSSSGNYGPRQTAHVGFGAIGGIVAAAMLL